MGLLRDAGVAFGCATMVTHRNLATVTSRAWFDRVWEHGARFYYIIDYVPFPADLDETRRLTPADMAFKRRALAERYAEARPLVMNFPPDEYAEGTCQAAGRGFIHVNADGFVEPCPFSHYAADNVLDKPLAEILGSEFFRGLRVHMDAQGDMGGACLLFATEPRVREIAARSGAFCTERRQNASTAPREALPPVRTHVPRAGEAT